MLTDPALTRMFKGPRQYELMHSIVMSCAPRVNKSNYTALNERHSLERVLIDAGSVYTRQYSAFQQQQQQPDNGRIHYRFIPFRGARYQQHYLMFIQTPRCCTTACRRLSYCCTVIQCHHDTATKSTTRNTSADERLIPKPVSTEPRTSRNYSFVREVVRTNREPIDRKRSAKIVI